MRYIKPVFYDEFNCTADKCPDTCCAGWQIMIDEDSLEYYGEVKGAFGRRLRDSIDWQEGSFYQNDRRCAFLNSENLCDLYIALGPDALCDTCRKYPRHVEEYEEVREWSLSLSCPVAARIILSQQGFWNFSVEEKMLYFDIKNRDEVNIKTGSKYDNLNVYIDNNLKDEDIHERVKRAKILVVNSKDEVWILHTDDSYYFLGGHVDGDESDYECLIREIKEEAGIDYDPKIDSPFISIKYLFKDYPEEGINRGYIANYYVVYDDMVPNPDNVSLTEGEAAGHGAWSSGGSGA